MHPKNYPKCLLYGVIASTFEEKAEMLKEFLFPTSFTPDLTDIEHAVYPREAECPQSISQDGLYAALRRQHPDKAPGPDGIPNRVLKALTPSIVNWLHPLIQACVHLSYHPRVFKAANTIALKTPGKADYTVPKAYRSISLLNTMGKILETVMAKRLSFFGRIAEPAPRLPVLVRDHVAQRSRLWNTLQSKFTPYGIKAKTKWPRC